MKEVADTAIKKEAKVYYFDRSGEARDISNLDPGSNDRLEAGWGGLSEFSGRVNEIVAKVVNQRLGPPGEEKVEPAHSQPVHPGEVAAEAQLPNLGA